MFDFLNKSISISFLALVKINTKGDKLLDTHTCRTYMAERMSCHEGSLLKLCDLTVRGEESFASLSPHSMHHIPRHLEERSCKLCGGYDADMCVGRNGLAWVNRNRTQGNASIS